MTCEPESNRPPQEQDLYCHDCGIELKYHLVCKHTELDCLRHQLTQVTAERDAAVEACRVTLAEGTMPWESLEIVRAVVAKADARKGKQCG